MLLTASIATVAARAEVGSGCYRVRSQRPRQTPKMEEIKVKFVVCGNCERVWPVRELIRHEHDFESEDGDLLVVYDYHCADCRAKLASWGTG